MSRRALTVSVLLLIAFQLAVLPSIPTGGSNGYTASAPFVVPLVMGVKNIPIGFIKVWNDDSNLYVLYEIDLDSYPDYSIYQTHLNISESVPSWGAPGLWTYQRTHVPTVTSELYTIPLSSIPGGYEPNKTIYLMAHASIYREGAEIGSAYGLAFKGYFNYTIVEQPPPEPLLAVTKTGPLFAYPNGVYLYTITVTNIGSVAAQNVNITDILPQGVEPLNKSAPGTPAGTYYEDAHKVEWIIDSIAPGGYAVVTLEVVFKDVSPGDTAVNTVVVRWDGNSVEASWSTEVVAGPSLVVEKLGPTKSYPGNIVLYTIAITNTGNETAYNVTLEDALDPNLDLVSTTPSGTLSDGGIVWSLGTLGRDQVFTVFITARVRDGVSNGTQITDTARITWEDEHGGQYTNSSTWITTVYTPPAVDITKTGPPSASPNQEIEYTISLVNLGGSPAYSVNISDRLPPGVSYVSASPMPSAVGNGYVNWTVAELPPGQSIAIRLRVRTPSSIENTCVDLVNNASVEWLDPSGGGTVRSGWDAFTTRVCTLPMLVVDKTGDTRGSMGEELDFAIRVSNVGGSPAQDVVVWDDLPCNLTIVSDLPPECSVSGRRLRCDIARIDPGTSASIVFRARVAQVCFDGVWVFNNVYANWTYSGVSYGPVADVHPIQLFANPYALVSIDGPATAYNGSTVTYTIKLRNPTLSTLNNIRLTYFVPLIMSYSSSSPSGSYFDSNKTVVWDIGTLESGEEKTFEVTVVVDPAALNGTIVLNSALVLHPYGSDSDIASTRIVVPSALPPTFPIGGVVETVNPAELLLPLIAVLALGIASGTALLLRLGRARRSGYGQELRYEG